MQIKLRNHIRIDGKEEIIEESFPCDYQRKAGKVWLTYHNSDKEKVLIAYDEKELSMTRFLEKPLVMRFKSHQTTEMTYLTLGTLTILTESYQIAENENKLTVHYQLLQHGKSIGSYHLTINYGNENGSQT